MAKQQLIIHQAQPTGGSDRTLKKNITVIQDALRVIAQLKPVKWHWKRKKGDTGELQHGFIAQEVAEVLPELVTEGTWEDGTQRQFLASDKILPYLVAAVKEQQAQIAALQKQVEAQQK